MRSKYVEAEYKTEWKSTSFKAKEIDGRAHVWHQGYWAQLNIPTFVRDGKLMVRADFFTSEEDLVNNNIKDYYADAGKTKWLDTGLQGTIMGDTKYVMVEGDWEPMNVPAWLNPDTNTLWVPATRFNEIIKFTK